MKGAHSLIEVQKELPSVICNIRYASSNNFTQKQLYPFEACYIHRELMPALRSITEALHVQNLRLKIFDAYRPHSYQFILWDHCPDERYVGNPHKGSMHNRGVALDCTLVDASGKELDMGTDFDDFSKKAHRSYSGFPQNILDNRKILETIFQSHGFIGLETEWWHFDYSLWNNFPLLSIPFEEL